MVRSDFTADARGKGREDRILLTVNSKNRDFFFLCFLKSFGLALNSLAFIFPLLAL